MTDIDTKLNLHAVGMASYFTGNSSGLTVSENQQGIRLCDCGAKFDTSEGMEWCEDCDEGPAKPKWALDPASRAESVLRDLGLVGLDADPNIMEVTAVEDLLTDLLHWYASHQVFAPGNLFNGALHRYRDEIHHPEFTDLETAGGRV